MGLLGLNNTWRRRRQQRVLPRAPALADVPGPGGGKTPLVGGPGPVESLASQRSAPAKATCSLLTWLRPRVLPPAPAGARGEADAMVAEGRPGLPTPRASSAGAQAPAERQAVAKVSCLPNLVLFPSVSMAGLQFKHGQEHARPGPCRAVLPLSPPLPPASSPPESWSAFYKAAKE